MAGKHRVILVEGLCGTGKSTLAERLHQYLTLQGISSHFYDEGAPGHPVSLNGHAFFRKEEFAGLLRRYPDCSRCSSFTSHNGWKQLSDPLSGS
ncbi:hypothetical protein DFQ01_11395 [Paenibacillus cellulosilyticus]|uniref:AAA domain-containing protein n=1 Tax=Paenibacillus cellulosilyticus TaxID=375489 RepID=A0A2V2YUY7_9BACL|nr:hypothetical protein DFQ01_11395 [Paenibacillus cellulosilyticus]